MKQVQLAIIGGGPAGLSAAIAAGKPGWRISSSSSGIGNWAVF